MFLEIEVYDYTAVAVPTEDGQSNGRFCKPLFFRFRDMWEIKGKSRDV